jgi:hypothetical protein
VRRTLAVAALVVTALLLASCAAGPNPASGGPSAAGFWQGLWQGFILPVTFVVSLFTDTVNIYEVHNDGNWYDFGYVLGLSIIFSGGGGAAGSRRR